MKLISYRRLTLGCSNKNSRLTIYSYIFVSHSVLHKKAMIKLPL